MVRVLALLLAPLVLLTGCVRLTADVTISSPSDIDVSMVVAMESAMADQVGQGQALTSACRTDQTQGLRGARVEAYDDGTYRGCRVSGTVTAAALASQDDPPLNVVFNRHDVTFQMGSSWLDRGASQGMEGLQASMISSFQVSVTFPGAVVEHSGSSTVKGRTVTWTDPEDLFAPGGLHAVGKRRVGMPLWGWLLVGLAVAGLVGIGAVVLVRRRRRRAQGAPATPAGGQVGHQPWARPTAGQPDGSGAQATPGPRPDTPPAHHTGDPNNPGPPDPDSPWRPPR